MIYYVEDDDNIRELVVYTLTQSGLPAQGFATPERFYAAVKERRPALVLLDVMLPGEDGISILKKLRTMPETADLPVMMLTAKGAEFDKVTGLDCGADDYLAKPFGMAELLARVRALLRRSKAAEASGPLVCEALTLDPEKHAVLVSGAPVELTYKEFSLLHHLMSHPGRAFNREQLLSAVWGYEYQGGTRTVDVHVQTLRLKLGDAGRHVATVRGLGYRFEE